MKKSKFFYLFSSALITGLFLYSCINETDQQILEPKKEIVNTQQPQNEANSTNFNNSQLLIVPIPFYDNMFHFPDEESFQAVKEEIGEKVRSMKTILSGGI